MNSPAFSVALSKLLSKLGSLALVWQSIKEKESHKFKPAVLYLKLSLCHLLLVVEKVGEYIQIYMYNFCPSAKV